MTLLVAITGWEVAPWVERFRRLLPDRRVVALGEPFEPGEILYAAAWKHPPGTFAGLPNLRAIFSLGAGVDHLVGDPALPDVPVVRVVDEDLTNRMSEYVVLHCLAHLRQARLYDNLQRERRWWDDRHQPAARDVRVGIMGLGVLGLDAARKLGVMGFDVAGWSRSPKHEEGLATFAGSDGLDAFLARTDILICLLPLTPTPGAS
jgi:glyoxylate/hydroxypyruvate reductase A